MIGAGVQRTDVDRILAEAGWPVRVWAAALPRQTTSAVAGAVWGAAAEGTRCQVRGVDRTVITCFATWPRIPPPALRMTAGAEVGDRIRDRCAMPPGLG